MSGSAGARDVGLAASIQELAHGLDASVYPHNRFRAAVSLPKLAVDAKEDDEHDEKASQADDDHEEEDEDENDDLSVHTFVLDPSDGSGTGLALAAIPLGLGWGGDAWNQAPTALVTASRQREAVPEPTPPSKPPPAPHAGVSRGSKLESKAREQQQQPQPQQQPQQQQQAQRRRQGQARRVQQHMDVSVVERWLNDMAERYIRSSGWFQARTSNAYRSPLDRLGLSRAMLRKQRLADDVIERLYVGLFVYSVGFHQVAYSLVKHCPRRGPLMVKVWQAYLYLLEMCDPPRYTAAVRALEQENSRRRAARERDYDEQVRDVDAEVHALEAEIQDLQSVRERVERECEEEARVATTLRSRVLDMRERFEVDTEKVTAITTAVNQWREGYQDAARDTSRLAGEHERLRSGHAACMSEVLDLQRTTRLETSKQQRLADLLASTRKNLAQVLSAMQDKRTLTAELEARTGELREALGVLQRRSAHRSQDNEEMQDRLDTNRSAIARLREEIDRLRQTVRDETAAADAERKAIADQRAKLDRLRSEAQAARTAEHAQQVETARARAQLSAARDQNDEQARALEAEQRVEEQLRAALAAERTQHTSLEDRHTQLRSESEAAATAAREADEARARLQLELHTARRSLVQHRGRQEAKERERDAAQQALESADATVRQRQEQLASAISAHAARLRELEKARTALVAELAALEERHTAQSRVRAEAEDAHDELAVRTDREREEVEAAERMLVAVKAAAAQLAEDGAAADERLLTVRARAAEADAELAMHDDENETGGSDGKPDSEKGKEKDGDEEEKEKDEEQEEESPIQDDPMLEERYRKWREGLPDLEDCKRAVLNARLLHNDMQNQLHAMHKNSKKVKAETKTDDKADDNEEGGGEEEEDGDTSGLLKHSEVIALVKKRDQARRALVEAIGNARSNPSAAQWPAFKSQALDFLVRFQHKPPTDVQGEAIQELQHTIQTVDYLLQLLRSDSQAEDELQEFQGLDAEREAKVKAMTDALQHLRKLRRDRASMRHSVTQQQFALEDEDDDDEDAIEEMKEHLAELRAQSQRLDAQVKVSARTWATKLHDAFSFTTSYFPEGTLFVMRDGKRREFWPKVTKHLAKALETEGLMFEQANIQDVYERTELLSKGTNHVILKAFLGDSVFAVKEHAITNASAMRRLQRETQILQRLRHPCIAAVNSVFVDSENHKAYLEMPYYEGGDLSHFLKAHKVDMYKSILPGQCLVREILRGIEYLHLADCIHCDIKPQNVFMTAEGLPKLGDFDISKDNSTRAKSLVQLAATLTAVGGAPAYMAPELFHAGATATSASDMYAFGLLVFNVFWPDSKLPGAQSMPKTPKQFLRKNKKYLHGCVRSAPQDVQTALFDFVCQLIEPDPVKRPTATEALSHEFLTVSVAKAAAVDKDDEFDDDDDEKDDNESDLAVVRRTRALQMAEERMRKERDALAQMRLAIEEKEAMAVRKKREAEDGDEATAMAEVDTEEVRALRAQLIEKEDMLRLLRADARPTGPPTYWTQRGASSHTGWELVDVTNTPLAQGVQRAMSQSCWSQYIGKACDVRKDSVSHKRFQVHKVLRLENPQLWRQYAQERSSQRAVPGSRRLKTENYDRALWSALQVNWHQNETLLFHGTLPALWNVIAQHGFEERLANIHAVYGAGIYMAENSSKADQYAVPDEKDGLCYMFMARASMGHYYKSLTMQPGLRRPPCVEGHIDDPTKPPCTHPRCDSLVGLSKKQHPKAERPVYREMVVYDRRRCYPELLVLYKRV